MYFIFLQIVIAENVPVDIGKLHWHKNKYIWYVCLCVCVYVHVCDCDDEPSAVLLVTFHFLVPRHIEYQIIVPMCD